MAEKNNELLLKNHGLRPTGSAPFPEANVVSYDKAGQESGRARGRGRGRGHRRGYTRGRGREVQFKKPYFHQKWETKMATNKRKQHMRTYVIDVEQKITGLVRVGHQNTSHQNTSLSSINNL